MRWVLMDFESANPDTKLLEDGGAWRYSEDILTEILCLLFSVDGQAPFTWTLDHREYETLLRELAADPTVIFKRHGDFELAMWRNIMVGQYNFPDISIERWHDTMACAAVRALPLGLEDLCSVLDLPVQKDMDGRKHTLGLSKPNKQGYFDRSGVAIQRTVEYCAVDIDTELEVDRRLGPLPPDEHGAWLLHQRMNERGLRIDLDYVAAAQMVVDKASVPLLEEFKRLTHDRHPKDDGTFHEGNLAHYGLKPSQIQKFKFWLERRGVKLPNLAAETVAATLGGSIDELDTDFDPGAYVAELPTNVRDALSIRQLIGSSSVKKLRRMAACVCADGRARGHSMFHGAGPGRSTGRLWQPLNFPRGTLKLDGEAPPPEIVVDAIMTGDPDYVSMVLGPPIETVVSGLRHAIIPDREMVFLSGDYAGVQARVVLALAGQYDKTALMASGADVYCDMAAQIYKRPIDKKHDPAERQVGKNSVLGLGFQMGWRKFRFKYGKHLTDEFCEEVVRVYRKEWAPKVPALWAALGAASLRAVQTNRPQQSYGVEYRKEDGWLSARLPSGRKLWYWNPQATKQVMPWYTEDNPDVRDCWTYQAQKNGQWKTITAFGGQLTENVVMGIEVDIQRHGWKVAEANGFPIVHDCYDELVAEVPEKGADFKGFLQCLLDVPRWLPALKIPVAVEGWHGTRYRK